MSRPDRKLRKEAAKRAAEYAARFGASITEQKKHECLRAGQLCAIADLMRDRAFSTGEVVFDQLKQAEQIAEAAVLSLGFPTPAGAVSRIEVELVSPQTPEYIQLLEEQAAQAQDEVRRLQRRVHELEQPGAKPSLPADPMLSRQPALPAPGSQAAAPATNNVVPLRGQDMTDQERRDCVAVLKELAGDTDQPLRLSHDGLGPGAAYQETLPVGFGHRRFDHPDHWS